MTLVAIPGPSIIAVIVYHRSGAVWLSGELRVGIEKLQVHVANLFGACVWTRLGELWIARFS